MTIPLKDSLFTEYQFNNFIEVVCSVVPNFESQKFLKQIFDKNWGKLELKERMRHITIVLHKFLPKGLHASAKIIITTSKYISENEYLENTNKLVKRKYSFKTITTRKYYPGKHKISIIVNGKELDCNEFILENK